MAEDLLHPKFKITRLQAMRARLKRNYGYIFIFLLLTWLGRAMVLPETQSASLDSIFAIGILPWWVPVSLVLVLYVFLLCLFIFTPGVAPPEECYWPDPKHSGEEIPNLDV